MRTATTPATELGSWILAILFAWGSSLALANEVRLNDKSVIRFATVPEGKALFQVRDRFIQALSPFDRQSRLETDRDVSEDEFMRFVASHVLPWEADEISKVTSAVTTLREKLAAFDLPFPAVVWIIQTTGREEGHAAYCRGNAIILPNEKIGEPAENVERLLNHELFHILERHNPAWRQSQYEIIGFRTCPPIEMPAPLKNRKLTNPDAPEVDCYLSLIVDGEALTAAPVLFSKSEKFDPRQGGPFFRYLVFRLLVVEKVSETWKATELNGEPRMLVPNEIPDFKKQVGSNTGYIIHPDEILADNFVHLVQKTKSLPSPQIVEKMDERLRTKPSP